MDDIEADAVLVPEAALTQFCAACLEAVSVPDWMGALPVGLFEDEAAYRMRMDKAVQEVRGVRRAAGVDRVFLPGERAALAMAERRLGGIPVGAGVLAELRTLGAQYGAALA